VFFDIFRKGNIVLNITIPYYSDATLWPTRGMTVARKGLSVWLLSSLTFVALMHLLDATLAFIFGNPIRLLQLYPFVGAKLQSIAPSMYFWATIVTTLILWGITCGIAFENPVDKFLNKILSDAKVHSTVETQLLESKSEVLDALFETIEATSETVAQVKDLVCNVRTDAKEIQPLRDSIENMKADLGSLKNEFKKIRENVAFPNICHACGKPLMPEFNMCPYCGESVRPTDVPVLTFKSLR
jgi:rRNA maturation endonuclease Nob1